MLGLDFRDIDDVIRDVEKLNTLCQEYKDIKGKYDTLLALTNISSMTKCSCRDFTNNITLSERMNCDICGGIGYVITYKSPKE